MQQLLTVHPMRLFGRSLRQTRGGEKHPEHEQQTRREVTAATTRNNTHSLTHTHARTHSHKRSKNNNQPLPTCDILAHTYETRGSDLFRSHVCSSLLSPPLLLLLLLSSTSSPLAVPSLLSLLLSLSQRWTVRMVSLPGIPAGHPTARRASWKKPCGCWEAG